MGTLFDLSPQRREREGVGFSGETATTSKEGSRRVNYPIKTFGGSDKQ